MEFNFSPQDFQNMLYYKTDDYCTIENQGVKYTVSMPFATMAFFKISAAYRADMACRSYQINIQLETDEEKQFLNSLLTKGTIISQNATLELLSSYSNIALKLQCNSLINYIIDYTNSIPTSV